MHASAHVKVRRCFLRAFELDGKAAVSGLSGQHLALKSGDTEAALQEYARVCLPTSGFYLQEVSDPCV